jgi:hypothetical protein
MHVFGAAVYSLMKEQKFDGKQETFRDFLIRMVRSGQLAAGKVKTIYDAFYRKGE